MRAVRIVKAPCVHKTRGVSHFRKVCYPYPINFKHDVILCNANVADFVIDLEKIKKYVVAFRGEAIRTKVSHRW